MRSCIFQICLFICAFTPNESSTTSHTLSIENEWLNFNEHVITIEEEEEEEWDESNVREFTKLVEQHEQT